MAIFIPFSIVFLTDILNSKEKKRNEFEKMVLNDEVFETKKIFWLSIIGIVFFSFFSGTDTPVTEKIVSIIAIIVFIFLFRKPFYKVLRFSEGDKEKLETNFLKSLYFSKICRFKNNEKRKKMIRAWESFWSEKSNFNERNFTDIFIYHIDNALKFKKFDLAIQLAETYVNNIQKRDLWSIGNTILPKVFEWNEILWKRQQFRKKTDNTEKKILNFFPQKHFFYLRDLTLKIYKKWNSENNNFWNWQYFGREFFQKIIMILLQDPYPLFSSYKEYIEEIEKRLEKITNEKEKEEYWRYINSLFTTFCPTLFDKVSSTLSKDEIWEDHYFPSKWKITPANKNNRIAHIVLTEFWRWAKDRIFKNENGKDFTEDLTTVINGIFPNIHSSLFTAFLMLFFSFDKIKPALEKKPNFYIFNEGVSFSGSVNEDEETRRKRLIEMMKTRELELKEETVQIILEFFSFWNKIKIYRDDLSEDQLEDWKNYTEKERESIIKKGRKEKLTKMKMEIESENIKKICGTSEEKESYRKDFLELIELLILEIEK